MSQLWRLWISTHFPNVFHNGSVNYQIFKNTSCNAHNISFSITSKTYNILQYHMNRRPTCRFTCLQYHALCPVSCNFNFEEKDAQFFALRCNYFMYWVVRKIISFFFYFVKMDSFQVIIILGHYKGLYQIQRIFKNVVHLRH